MSLRMSFGRMCLAGTCLIACAWSGTTAANQVSATREGGLLVVTGDAVGNQVTISQNAAGDVAVTGLNGTLVNGLSVVRFRQFPVNALEVRLEDGDDLVNLRGLRIANDLYVNLGPGADRITATVSSPTSAGNNVTVEGADGADTIRLEGLAVGSSLFVDGGLGVLNCTLGQSAVQDNITVIADAANDVVNLTGLSAGGTVSVETKDGADRVTANGLRSLLLAVVTDAGADRVTMTGITTDEDLGITTGVGNDVVTLTDVAAGKSILVSVDEGTDRVTGAVVTAAQDAIFEGGAGIDTLEDLGIQGGVKKEVKEFEVLLP